jgi:hypothetical protein
LYNLPEPYNDTKTINTNTITTPGYTQGSDLKRYPQPYDALYVRPAAGGGALLGSNGIFGGSGNSDGSSGGSGGSVSGSGNAAEAESFLDIVALGTGTCRSRSAF